jgi:hypothetical protein
MLYFVDCFAAYVAYFLSGSFIANLFSYNSYITVTVYALCMLDDAYVEDKQNFFDYNLRLSEEYEICTLPLNIRCCVVFS